MNFKDLQAPVLFSSTFKALNSGEKNFKYFQGLWRMRGNPGSCQHGTWWTYQLMLWVRLSAAYGYNPPWQWWIIDNKQLSMISALKPESPYLCYHHTEVGELNQPGHCSNGVCFCNKHTTIRHMH